MMRGMFLGVLFSAPLTVLAMLLCAAIGWVGIALCANGALGFWPAIFLVGGAYFVLYLTSRWISEINSLGVTSLLGLLGVMFASICRLLSYVPAVFLIFILLVLAVTTGVAYASIFRRRWQQDIWVQTGMCMQCGYDLRASDERCPECGAALPEYLTRLRRLRSNTTPATPSAPDDR